MRLDSKLEVYILFIMLALSLALLVTEKAADDALHQRISALEFQVQHNSDSMKYQWMYLDGRRRNQPEIIELLEDKTQRRGGYGTKGTGGKRLQ